MFVFFLLLMTGIAQADVYVLVDKKNAVVGLSEQNDIVAPADHKIEVLENKYISDLPINQSEAHLYDFKGSKFSLNSKRVSDKNKAEQDEILARQKKEDNRTSAINKLKEIGLTDAEIEAITK